MLLRKNTKLILFFPQSKEGGETEKVSDKYLTNVNSPLFKSFFVHAISHSIHPVTRVWTRCCQEPSSVGVMLC